MSQKNGYKKRTERAMILQQFREHLTKHNMLDALLIYDACIDIPIEEFTSIWHDVHPTMKFDWPDRIKRS